MAVVIESEIWVPNKALYLFLIVSCFFSLFYLPTKSAGHVFDHSSSATFQRNFLVVFVLSSVIHGSSAVFGDYELAYFGFSKEQVLNYLCIGYATSLILGNFLGILFDIIGHKKSCLLFYLLHLWVSVWKIFAANSAIWLASFCLSLASSIYFFGFETLMVVEIDHNKVGLGPRQDSVNDMFWLMTLFECASFIGSQFLGNYLINHNANKSTVCIWKETMVLSVAAIIYVTRGWKGSLEKPAPRDSLNSFRSHVFSDARIRLLACAQACVHFSMTTFWILWAPTVIADGREISLGLIYPCLMGFKMLGSIWFPWFYGPLALRVEDYLVYTFLMMGTVLTVVAYDYQDIEVLLILFYLFHACAGVVLPSLARLRTVYVPNEVRGGMMSLSLIPANTALLFLLILRGHYEYIGNSIIVAFGAFGMFLAAGCMFMLKKWGKLHQNRYNL